ncbi:hypothetical protein SLS60_003019 [Paraconiothyrium brasiliense]|uniref:Uncharacterized protein n=1 Tax=Paraconiothyrium brasiliense TaxID=300254 RepID=A0ABR3RUG7_9PLEO
MNSILPTIVILFQALSAHAIVTCNHEHPADVHLPRQDPIKAIQPLLNGPGYALCNDIPYTNASEILYFESQHYTFQIDRQKHTDTVENCRAALESIVSKCVVSKKVLGDAFVNDIGYEIYHTELRERSDPELEDWLQEIEQWSKLNGDDEEEPQEEAGDDINVGVDEDEDENGSVEDNVDKGSDDDEEDNGEEFEEGLGRREMNHNDDVGFYKYGLGDLDLDHHSLQARRGGRGGGRQTRPRPSKKKPASKKKPVRKPTKTPKKPTKKPTEKPTKKPAKKPTKKPTAKPTKKPSKKPTKCPGDKKTKPGPKAKLGQVQLRAPGVKTTGGKGRTGSAGGSCQQDQKLNCRLIVKKARAKNAERMPKIACWLAMSLMRNAHVYGWAHPLQCENMQWGGSHNNFHKVPRAQGGEYEIEHVLEWQTVTRFFEWLNDHHFAKKRKFTDPDPTQGGARIDFCEYWSKTWATQAFTIDVNGRSRVDAKKHIARQYPGVNFRNEFVWLQKDINKPAKQNMWAYKGTNQVYDLPKALRAIRANINDAAVEAFNVKALLGAQKYMKNPIVKQFFIDQKQRIGVALDEVDRALPNHPPAPGHAPWQFRTYSQSGLLTLWNTYMDQAFAEAVSRTDRTMDTMLNALEARWVRGHPAQNPLKAQIKKLRTQWRWEKRSGWHRPNW